MVLKTAYSFGQNDKEYAYQTRDAFDKRSSHHDKKGPITMVKDIGTSSED